MEAKPEVNYTYHGAEDWIPQANRLVKTFRSGLCMVTQDYICRNDDKVNYQSFNEGDKIDDATPCMDDAYIFPAPDYQDMGNGFIKATVTAYSRVNTSGVVEISKRIGDYYVAYYYNKGGSVDIGFFKSQKLFDVVTYRFVIKRGDNFGIPGSVTPKIYNLDLSEVKEYNPMLNSLIELYEVTSFGEFDSIVISVLATGSGNRFDEGPLF
jgi:hypothetical protein